MIVVQILGIAWCVVCVSTALIAMIEYIRLSKK